MRCQDTAGSLPAVHISQEAFEVAQEYHEVSQMALIMRIHEWSITFRKKGNNLPSIKYEFFKLFRALKKQLNG